MARHHFLYGYSILRAAGRNSLSLDFRRSSWKLPLDSSPQLFGAVTILQHSAISIIVSKVSDHGHGARRLPAVAVARNPRHLLFANRVDIINLLMRFASLIVQCFWVHELFNEFFLNCRTEAAPRCTPCNGSGECSRPPHCPYGYVKDYCGRSVCAKVSLNSFFLNDKLKPLQMNRIRIMAQ